MTGLLAAPLLPAALLCVVTAIAARASLPGALALAAGLAAAAGVLAWCSVGRRRWLWVAAAVAPATVALHAAMPVALIALDASLLALPRESLVRPLELLVPAPESALLLGIVLGERGAIPASLGREFAATGTTHLLAISGFNMTLVASAVALALRGRAGPAVRAALSVGAVAAYSLLVGLSPSVLRAALMASVAACGVVSGRRAATANALCAAVVAMLVIDPAAVEDVGFQLSALATAGLILWQASLADGLRALPAPIGEGVATTLAATLPTLPVVAATFGRVSLVAPLANLVCVPLFPVLMLAGAATSAAGAISLDAARPIALVAWAAAAALRWAVGAFAALPLASLTVPSGAATGVAVAGLEVAALQLGRRMPPVASLRTSLRTSVRASYRAIVHASGSSLGVVPAARRRPGAARRWIAIALAAALAPPLLAASWPVTSGVRVVALDVGQGDAYLVEVNGARALIDGGPDPARIAEELGATLPPWDRRIDVVALTHAHADHGAGLVAVVERYEIGLAIEPVGLNPGPLADLWAQALAARGIERRAVTAGQTVSLGAAVISVLAPDPDLAVDVPSLVLRIEQGPFSVLFTGDAVEDAQARLLARPERLRSRVYVPPHHGAETPHAGALRAAARPEAALISAGAGNRYGHPTAQTLQALSGVPTYRTDKDGTVEIAQDGTGLTVRTHANALPPPRRGSVPYPPARQ